VSDTSHRIVIAGGGILGLSTAYRLMERLPDCSITLLEKEDGLATHQTGHNSGVLHTGIYYRPGSLKATNCREGKRQMQAFCDMHDIPYDICGKVVVATREEQLPMLQTILERGQANGAVCRMIDRDELQAYEPEAAGIRAIHVPEAGIVNYRQICLKLGELLTEQGVEVHLGEAVTGLETRGSEQIVHSAKQTYTADTFINCTGLHCDRLARLGGYEPEARIVPFRGEYFMLKPEARHLCKNLIYPVPDLKFPFLGVHFTRMINGDVECGPNAVLAFAREGYRKTDVNWKDLCETFGYKGARRLFRKHFRMGLGEIHRSISKRAFVKALQHLVPAIQEEHLIPAEAGIRAQAVAPDGRLVDDFLITRRPGQLHVLNAPSPAATSALNIGKTLAEMVVPEQ
jgi:(S)-2-hydroxyglutarate dehydrogenase